MGQSCIFILLSFLSAFFYSTSAAKDLRLYCGSKNLFYCF